MQLLKFVLICCLFVSVNTEIRAAVSPAHAEIITPAATPANNEKKALEMQQRLSQLKFYCSLSIKDYEKLKGKKLNFFSRQAFKLTQHRMRKILKAYSYGDGPTTLEKIGWLCKGILLGPIAVLMAYIFLKDEDRELIKWAWFGCIGFAVLLVLVLAMI